MELFWFGVVLFVFDIDIDIWFFIIFGMVFFGDIWLLFDFLKEDRLEDLLEDFFFFCFGLMGLGDFGFVLVIVLLDLKDMFVNVVFLFFVILEFSLGLSLVFGFL